MRVLGRRPGRLFPVVVSVDGITHTLLKGRRMRAVDVIGGASSVSFTGERRGEILRPASAMLTNGTDLTVHTSVAESPMLHALWAALRDEVPWRSLGLNLQLEGSSAVFAGVEQLLATQPEGRQSVGVCAKRYHGPATTTLPCSVPWNVEYPAPPTCHHDRERHALYLQQFDNFLRHNNVGVMVFEPQFGSSRCGAPWPPSLLRACTRLAKNHGARVLCDEVMCGMGRHGQGTMFLSKALKLETDAIVFGKAVACGAFPLAGVAIAPPHCIERRVVQCHTYAGASTMAIVSAARAIRYLSTHHAEIARRASICERTLGNIKINSLAVHGQGLLWGVEWTLSREERERAQVILRERCAQFAVLPYFVECGALVTPPLDVCAEQLEGALQRFVLALRATCEDIDAH